MGLIKAVAGAAFGTIADMWVDYIYCDSMDSTVLVKKGQRKKSGGAGALADDNVITEGTSIAVAPGQMMIVVEHGKIVDYTAEQGGYIFESSASPGLYNGEFKEQFQNTIREMGHRFLYGGAAPVDQRAYFVNTKEILDNRFGFGKIPFREGEFHTSIFLQGYGVFSFRITNPLTFFLNISGNVKANYTREVLLEQMKAELSGALLPVMGKLAQKKLVYDELPLEEKNIAELLREELTEEWRDARGIELQTLSFQSILPDEESIDKIRQLQESRVYADDRTMLGARMSAATANAMESAAENANGAAYGFVSMAMAQQMGAAAGNQAGNQTVNQAANQAENQAGQEAQTSWVCEACGQENHLNFCEKCGQKRPDNTEESRFCSRCGYRLQNRASQFCPRCGKKLDED